MKIPKTAVKKWETTGNTKLHSIKFCQAKNLKIEQPKHTILVRALSQISEIIVSVSKVIQQNK